MIEQRRRLLAVMLGTFFMPKKGLGLTMNSMELAAAVIEKAVGSGQVQAASIAFRKGGDSLHRSFGMGIHADSSFLLGSISKPMVVASLMKLYERGAFRLEDRVQQWLPEFQGSGKGDVTILHLLTHVSGLPDQLPNNATLRKEHAPLQRFAEEAMKLPLAFAPGTKYEYSSMAILLACEIGQRIAGRPIAELCREFLLEPLSMHHSALGIGKISKKDLVMVQTDRAAPESGGGDPSAKDWDWNSSYWRKLGAPWGGLHASAADVLKFLESLVRGGIPWVSDETKSLILRNHNGTGLPPRGIGLALGPSLSEGLSQRAFGHTGSTGTVAWHDPTTDTSCVVLTSLPGGAVRPHPRELASLCLSK